MSAAQGHAKVTALKEVTGEVLKLCHSVQYAWAHMLLHGVWTIPIMDMHVQAMSNTCLGVRSEQPHVAYLLPDSSASLYASSNVCCGCMLAQLLIAAAAHTYSVSCL